MNHAAFVQPSAKEPNERLISFLTVSARHFGLDHTRAAIMRLVRQSPRPAVRGAGTCSQAAGHHPCETADPPARAVAPPRMQAAFSCSTSS